MMRAYIDLHIHSALSPCANEDMTPNNIVNMAVLKGLRIIAVTDHNAIGNVAPTAAAAKAQKLLVVPGIEITTQEEVHLLAYFRSVEQLSLFYAEIESSLPRLENRPDIFGRQLIFDQNDQIVSEDRRLLMNAVQISFDRMVYLIRSFHGIPIPAHANRGSFSVLSNLGFMPPGLPIDAIEVVLNSQGEFTDQADARKLAGYRQIVSSDAHDLGSILEQVFFIELNEIAMDDVIRWLDIPKAGDET
jgi:3',5'-nucleoside bisphosphate phosphatase